MYAEFIRNGTMSNVQKWKESKNWVHLNPNMPSYQQSDWNDDSEHSIYKNCGFLDQLDAEVGVYLKK